MNVLVVDREMFVFWKVCKQGGLDHHAVLCSDAGGRSRSERWRASLLDMLQPQRGRAFDVRATGRGLSQSFLERHC